MHSKARSQFSSGQDQTSDRAKAVIGNTVHFKLLTSTVQSKLIYKFKCWPKRKFLSFLNVWSSNEELTTTLHSSAHPAACYITRRLGQGFSNRGTTIVALDAIIIVSRNLLARMLLLRLAGRKNLVLCAGRFDLYYYTPVCTPVSTPPSFWHFDWSLYQFLTACLVFPCYNCEST